MIEADVNNSSIKCDTALNGKIAIEKVRQREEERLKDKPCSCGKETGNYTLILMDCNMPVMDGFQATQAIREMFKTNQKIQPCIVALTAYNTKKFEEKCFEAGMDRFLTKPLDSNDL